MTAPEQGVEGLSLLPLSRPATPLTLEVPAQAQHLAFVRHVMTEWLDGIGVGEQLSADIILVVVEACTNSIEHAYRNQGHGVVRVSAHQQAGAVCITVDDSGHWKAELVTDRTRGRGMPLMRAVSTRFELSTGPAGTTVSMAFDAPSAPGRQ
jgi:anti-sigma regulatory factor (Ser/Thr protein kinase)